MAVTVRIDEPETLSMDESYGTLTGVVRKAFVNGLSGTSWDVMYDVLDAAGLPVEGSYLDADRGRHLILIKRSVNIINKEKAEVMLTYGSVNDRGQRLFHDSGIVVGRKIIGKMRASVAEKKTNMYREAGTGEEELITLQHTYPDDDLDYPGKTVSQTGEVSVQIPQDSFTIDGIKETTRPWDIKEALTSSVRAINFAPG